MNRPSFQFYPQDWLTEYALMRCSLAAQGLWIQMLCLMHKGEPYGHLRFGGKAVKEEDIPSLVSLGSPECNGDVTSYNSVTGALQKCYTALHELKTNNIYSVNSDGIIYSRRMIRDEENRCKTRNRVQKHRDKENECNALVTQKKRRSSSSSSTSVTNTDLSSESSKTQTLQKAAKVGSVPSKRFSNPENSKGKSKTLSAGAAAWRGLEVSWEEYCSGISWSEDEAAVKLDGLAGAGLRQHLRRLAQEEELPMLSDTQLQEGWGKMNSNFLADPRKRGKHLPSHVMKWLESDMRRLSSYSKGQGQKPDAFKVALEKALLEEEKDAGK